MLSFLKRSLVSSAVTQFDSTKRYHDTTAFGGAGQGVTSSWLTPHAEVAGLTPLECPYYFESELQRSKNIW
jgi:hypothetical protein